MATPAAHPRRFTADLALACSAAARYYIALHMLNTARHLQKQHGVTLIELMVTISVLAVLTALAAPSFTPLIERWRVRGAVEDLQTTLYHARSEAIKRGGGVTITAIDGDWSKGWTVEDANDEEVQNTGERAGVSIDISTTGAVAVTKLTFDRWGVMSPAAAFSITPKGKDADDPHAQKFCFIGAAASSCASTSSTPPPATP